MPPEDPTPPVRRLLRDHGATDPRRLVAELAHERVRSFAGSFPDQVPSVDLDVFVSWAGIRLRNEPPLHSADAELRPAGDGSVVIVADPDRPETRRRFSIAHEWGHTLFPGYRETVRCRHAEDEELDRFDDLERLCDRAAACLLMPRPWFPRDVEETGLDAAGFLDLRERYRVSPDALAIRAVETAGSPRVAVCFRWGLRKAERTRLEAAFGPEREAILARRVPRVAWFVLSGEAREDGIFVPPNKSAPDDSVVARVARAGEVAEAVEEVSLGPFRGAHRVTAVPIWTPEPEREAGRHRVIAVYRPPE